MAADIRIGLDRSQTGPDDPSIFVYLKPGLVEEFRPASSVFVTGDEIIILYGEAPMAYFPRSQIFCRSKALISPFPLWPGFGPRLAATKDLEAAV